MSHAFHPLIGLLKLNATHAYPQSIPTLETNATFHDEKGGQVHLSYNTRSMEIKSTLVLLRHDA